VGFVQVDQQMAVVPGTGQEILVSTANEVSTTWAK
jgi:hypothetical protein